jgi:FAD/FMN-containing dehydrogenase
MTRSAPDWDALQRAIAGDVILPSSLDYESVRKPAIARFHDVRPQAVVLCETPADVSETISFARRTELQTATRSGGHCFAGRSSTGGVVIDVTPMRSVWVSGGVVTVGAGARLGDMYDTLAEHGLTIPAGCGPSVGIAGLTLGGGLGILGRKHGLTSDHLLGAQVVLADGRVLESDDHHDEELFWALRGAGGGNFGVVTSLVFKTLPAPVATSFHLVWPHAHAVAVIGAWQALAPAAPDELAASLLVTAAGDAEKPPVVNLFGVMLGTESDTAELLYELVSRAGADPTSAFSKHASYRETKRYLAKLGDAMAGDDERFGDTSQGEPSQQGHRFSKSEFFRRPLPTEAIAALVENLSKGRVPGQSRELDFTPWGGAYNRVRADATAFVHRDELFMLQHAVVVDPNAPTTEREAARRWLARSWASVHPWGSGRVYQNFPDPDLEDWAHAYHGTNYDRLVRVKARYDPGGFFRFQQSLSSHVPRRGAPPT